MQVKTIHELMDSDLHEVICQNRYWPNNFTDVADVIDNELKECPDLLKVGRPILLLLCQSEGPYDLFIPKISRLKSFLIEKRLYDLHFSAPETALAAASQLCIKPETFNDVIRKQAVLHGEDIPSIGCRWSTEVIRFIDVISGYLGDTDLTEPERYQIKSSVLYALSLMSNKGLVYIPSCKQLWAEIRDRRMFQLFDGSNQRPLARQFNVSLQQVYRSIKQQTQRHREVQQQTITST